MHITVQYINRLFTYLLTYLLTLHIFDSLVISPAFQKLVSEPVFLEPDCFVWGELLFYFFLVVSWLLVLGQHIQKFRSPIETTGITQLTLTETCRLQIVQHISDTFCGTIVQYFVVIVALGGTIV